MCVALKDKWSPIEFFREIMINQIAFELGKAIDILLDLKEQRTFYFDLLSDKQKAALNQKELIEDDYFIRLQHYKPEIQEKIDELCPLNFFVNEDLQIVAYNEDDTHL